VEDAILELTVLVDEDSAPPLTSGREKLEDILVLHLEKGKDFFISVTGNYLPSCFGSSLETLVNLHTYIREVPVAQLVDLVSNTYIREVPVGQLVDPVSHTYIGEVPVAQLVDLVCHTYMREVPVAQLVDLVSHTRFPWYS